jgi:hypothetical protein
VVSERVTQEIPRHSYADQLARFDAACSWLAVLGVDINRTRLGIYRRVLGELVEKHSRDAIDELLGQYGFPLLSNVLFESTELIDIHEGLRGGDANVTQSLGKFAAGCTLLTEERRTGNNVARNAGFELDTAAAFRRCGFSISLLPPADFWVRVADSEIAVECKRPFSYDGLRSNFEKAFSQLRQRYRTHEDPSNVRGIVALSASKMENDGSFMLKADNSDDLNSSIRLLSNEFVTKTEPYWDSARDHRTIGILVSLRAPAQVTDIKLFTVARHFTWIGLANNKTDQILFRSITEPFNRLKPSGEKA